MKTLNECLNQYRTVLLMMSMRDMGKMMVVHLCMLLALLATSFSFSSSSG